MLADRFRIVSGLAGRLELDPKLGVCHVIPDFGLGGKIPFCNVEW